MISYENFLRQVEMIKPSILKNHRDSFKCSVFQIISLFLLVFFSLILFIPMIYFAIEKMIEGTYLKEDREDLLLALMLLSLFWGGIYFSMKFSKTEKKEEYELKSPTLFLDINVGLIGFIILCFILQLDIGEKYFSNEFFAPLLIGLDVGLVVYYYRSKRRKEKNEKVKDNIPLYRILSLLGINQKIAEDRMFILNNGIYFSYKEMYGELTFKIPLYNSNPEIFEKLKEKIYQFVVSNTGKDLFFHKELKKKITKIEKTTLLLKYTENPNSLKLKPNLYFGKYFYYSKEDLPCIYQDVKNLLEIFENYQKNKL